MRLLSSKQSIAATFDALLERYEAISFAVAWASCGFDSCDQLLRAYHKIRQGVVGTHFYQTDPEFITSLLEKTNVKFILNPSGVFHPKVYLFHGRGASWTCLIGSANFTAGAFGENSELLVHIDNHDDPTGTIGQAALHQIETYWGWQAAKYADAIDLARYKYWRDHFRRPFERSQGKFGTKKASKNLEEIALLNMGWSDFFVMV